MSSYQMLLCSAYITKTRHSLKKHGRTEREKDLRYIYKKKHVVFRKFTHTNLRHVRVINTAILHHSATTLSHDGTFFPVYGA